MPEPAYLKQIAAMILAAIKQHDSGEDFDVSYEPDWPRSLYVIYRSPVSSTLHVRVSVQLGELTADLARDIAMHIQDVRDHTYRNFHSFKSQSGETVWQATLGEKGLAHA